MAEPAPETAPGPSTVHQRAGDLHERARLGGIFYVASWLLVTGFSGAWEWHPIASGLVTVLFLALLLLRMRVRAGFLRDPGRAAETMREQWGVKRSAYRSAAPARRRRPAASTTTRR